MDTESLEDGNDGPQGRRFSETTFQKYGQTVADEPLCGLQGIPNLQSLFWTAICEIPLPIKGALPWLLD